MPHSWKGVIGGFVGSVVLAILFVMFHATGLFPDLDIVTLIDHLGSIGRGGAWADHFIVGALLWGPIFAAFDATTGNRPRWQKGLIFSVGAWIAMMLLFMPVVGGGVFGWRFGLSASLGMFVLHLIYGFIMGVSFELLDRIFPTRALIEAPEPLKNFKVEEPG
jgi:hypothetical protein